MKQEVLSNYQLEYEEMEPKQVSKTTAKTTKSSTKSTKTTAKAVKKAPKVPLKDRLLAKLKPVRSKIDIIIAKVYKPSKKAKKLTKAERDLVRLQKMRGIIGIGLLFVVVSIAYSTYMTVLFVDGTTMVLALAPQVIFATIVLLIAFYKIYK